MLSMMRFAHRLFRTRRVQLQPGEYRVQFGIQVTIRNSSHLVAHANMEILYMNHLVAAIFLSFFSLLTHINFWGSLIIRSECDVKFSSVLCIIMNTPVHICTHAVSLSLFFLCLERLASTLFYRSYETAVSRLPKAVVGAQYLLCALLFYYQIYTVDTQKRLSICSLIDSSNQHRTTHVQCVTFALELTSLITFTSLNNYNKLQLKRTIGMSLRDRYQLDENIRCLRTILPTIIMHTLCFFISNIITFIIYLIVTPRKSEVVLSLNWLPYYSVLLPVVISYVNRRAKGVHVRTMCKNAATGVTMQNNYFETLNNAWK
ncbi:hypothetical protein PMAYCL1PPCAC_09134 [Pristionchus mayeri]|uniref:G protein-coupled receptor n=1 Tax=Pristionchus mayeri TaxID=1317129 RepID=A0AAN4ZGB0_9BILA|nr:hypothetical protein PMAYCL1PPCAC_09134 [Pristionchus mayeri]